MEIFSEWGCAEHDRAPFPYIRHTEAGRWTRNTWQSFLAEGYRLGAIASTDDHLGYPGAYREGLAAVLAPELTREAIFAALRARRTYAVSGDRILLDYRLNGHVMGQELPYVRRRDLYEDSSQKSVVLRIRGGLETRLTVSLRLPNKVSVSRTLGQLAESGEMLFTGPFPRESAMLHRLVFHENYHTAFRWTDEDDGRAVNWYATVHGDCPNFRGRKPRKWGCPLPAQGDRHIFRPSTGRKMSQSPACERLHWYYVRVVQANGQMAWSGPIWVECRPT